MATTGSWNTQEVHPSTQPQKETSKVITFARPYTTPPRLPLGINSLDIGNDANVRVWATATDITKTLFKASLNTWDDTTLFSAGASWAELPQSYYEYQNGEFSTMDDHPSDKPQTETSRRIDFLRPFLTPPKVIVFLRELDMGNSKNCRVITEVSGIDKNGFTIHINTWDDSILYSATACWIAHQEDRQDIFSTTANTQDLRPSTKPQLYNSKAISFGGAAFWRPPKVFMAIYSLDFDKDKNLRIKVDATDVTQTGLTWHMDSWDDSIFYSAGVSILAIA